MTTDAKTREEIREACVEAIREAQLRNAIHGTPQRLWLYPDGSISINEESGYTRPMPEVDCVQIFHAEKSYDGPGRDAWEWYSLDGACDPDSDDAELIEQAIKIAGGYREALQAETDVAGEPDNTRCVFFSRDEATYGWYYHKYEPHDWEEPELDSDTEEFIAEHF